MNEGWQRVAGGTFMGFCFGLVGLLVAPWFALLLGSLIGSFFAWHLGRPSDT